MGYCPQDLAASLWSVSDHPYVSSASQTRLLPELTAYSGSTR